MEDKLDTLFQYWNKFDSKVFVAESKPTDNIETKEKGNISILGLIADIAKQKNTNDKFDYLIKHSHPNDRKEIFFHRVSKNKLA